MKQWVIPHTHTHWSTNKTTFLIPRISRGRPESTAMHPQIPAATIIRMNALAWQLYCRSILVSHTCTQMTGPMQGQRLFYQNFPQWNRHHQLQSCALCSHSSRRSRATERAEGAQKARSRCAIRAPTRRKQSTFRLYWINSNIKRCLQIKEQNVAKKKD